MKLFLCLGFLIILPIQCIKVEIFDLQPRQFFPRNLLVSLCLKPKYLSYISNRFAEELNLFKFWRYLRPVFSFSLATFIIFSLRECMREYYHHRKVKLEDSDDIAVRNNIFGKRKFWLRTVSAFYTANFWNFKDTRVNHFWDAIIIAPLVTICTIDKLVYKPHLIIPMAMIFSIAFLFDIKIIQKESTYTYQQRPRDFLSEQKSLEEYCNKTLILLAQ